MGDLISKSALLEEIKKFFGNQRYLISEEVCNLVENFPTYESGEENEKSDK